MRMKRAAAFTLAGLMAVSMTACGSRNGGSAKGSTSDSTEETKNEAAATAGKKDASEKLVVWTLADDLKQFAERYCEKKPGCTDRNCDHRTCRLSHKDTDSHARKTDHSGYHCREPQMLEDMYEADILRIWIRSLTMPRTMRIRL
mgnify:CR=1 FL=1